MSRHKHHDSHREHHGAIGWMTENRVTPNLLMLICLVGGFFVATQIKQEVFPEFDADMVRIMMVYPGASPEEVERGIILAIEEAVEGLEGVKEITATASEGIASVQVEIEEGADAQRVYQDIKQQVDAITTFPEDAEKPDISLAMMRREVLQLQLYGATTEWVLRELAEQVRDQLLQDEGITQVDLVGTRAYEVAIEVDQDVLRAYNLTLDEIASRVSGSSVEVPGGTIETQAGDIMLRVNERRYWADEFATIPLITSADGAVLRLGDVADVKDTFEETDTYSTYNGMPAVALSVYRVGDQTPIGVSSAAHKAMSQIEASLPPGIHWVVSDDDSDVYRQRLTLLLKNAFYGLALVLLLLGLFLDLRLAFWVTMGIPISFLGCFLFMPSMDLTINMISMFAFIIALGIVVDDAIVVGENIYEYRQRGMTQMRAAILGARDVLLPVTFSILTNIVAFMPLCFVPGMMGKIFRTIPLVVITVFSISWVEALFILPCHLAHGGSLKDRRKGLIGQLQHHISLGLDRFINKLYAPFLDACIRSRVVVVSLSLAVLIIILGYVASGRIGIILMPRVESDVASVTATLPYGSPLSRVQEIRDRLVASAEKTVQEHGGEQLAEGTFASIEENSIEVLVYLTDPEIRPISSSGVNKPAPSPACRVSCSSPTAADPAEAPP